MPTCIEFGHGYPVLTPPGQMLTVLKQTPSKRAAQQRVAVAINTPGEVLARHANPCPREGDEIPLVHPDPLLHHAIASTSVQAADRLEVRGGCASPIAFSIAG